MMKKIIAVLITLAFLSGIGVTASADEQTPELKPGDYVVFGMMFGSPILWQCVDIDENGPLMYSDKIISVKAFDGKGESLKGSHVNSLDRRRRYGSNRWTDSNIRDWMRSGEKIEYTCGNTPVKAHGWAADGALQDYLDGGFLKFFTKQELDMVKTVEIKTPLYEAEYPDMSPYVKKISEAELILMNDPSVEKEIIKPHKRASDVTVYWKNGEIAGMFEQNKYEETSYETFFLPSVFKLQELQMKTNGTDIKNLLHKSATEECEYYEAVFRYYRNTDLYINSDYGTRFAVATRTPVTKTPDLVCFSSENLKPMNEQQVYYNGSKHNETSLAPIYSDTSVVDYAYDNTHTIAPMFYFKKGIKFAAGDGSYENPYSVEHNGTQVLVNGRNVFMTEEPYVSGNVGLVSVHDLCEALGVRVNETSPYMPEKDSCVYLTYDNKTYQLLAGREYAVNVQTGERIMLNAAPESKVLYSKTFYVNGAPEKRGVNRIYAMVDDICKLFGFSLLWDGENGNLHILTPSGKYFDNYPQTCYPKFTCFYQTESTSGVYEYKKALPALEEYRKYLSLIGIKYTESAVQDGETVMRYSYDGAPPYDFLEIRINSETKTLQISTWGASDKYDYEESLGVN